MHNDLSRSWFVATFVIALLGFIAIASVVIVIAQLMK